MREYGGGEGGPRGGGGEGGTHQGTQIGIPHPPILGIDLDKL